MSLGVPGRTLVDCEHYCHIVTMAANPLPGPEGAPDRDSNDDRDKLLRSY